MTAEQAIPLLLAALLLTLAAGVRAIRSAFTSFTTSDRQRLEEGNPMEQRLATLLGKRRDVDTSLMIAHHAATLGFVVALTGTLQAFGVTLWITPLLAPPLLLAVGELLPRAAGRRLRGLLSRWGGAVLRATFLAMTPVRVPLATVATTLSKALFGAESSGEEGLDEAEFLMLLENSAEVGALEQNERDFVESVFEFDDIVVGRLMTPRPEIFALPLDLPWEELIERTRKEGYSRIPVYADRSDNIIGVLLVKDLLRCSEETTQRERRRLLLTPSFVPANRTAEDMLRDFMDRKHHMSFVVDEHGTLVGLVTIDDLLEALVGDLEEDADDKTAPIIRRQPDLVTVKASMEIADFTQQTGLAVPEGDYHTLGGFVFHLLGKVPEPGDATVSDGYQYTIRKMQGRRIDEIDIELIPLSATEMEAS